MPLTPDDLQKNEYYQKKLAEAYALPAGVERERAKLAIRTQYVDAARTTHSEITFLGDTELLMGLTAKPSPQEDKKRAAYLERLKEECKVAEGMQKLVGNIDARNTVIIRNDFPTTCENPPMFYEQAQENAFRAQWKLDDATKKLQSLVNLIHAATLGHYDPALSVLDNFKAAEIFCAKRQDILDKRFPLPEMELPF